MEVQDFIETIVTGIVEATKTLQDKHREDGVVINPPQSTRSADVYSPTNSGAKKRVQLVAFDMAVTVGSETAGESAGKLKIATFVEIGGKGDHSQSAQEVSRVQFTLPVVLPDVGVPDPPPSSGARGGRSAPA